MRFSTDVRLACDDIMTCYSAKAKSNGFTHRTSAAIRVGDRRWTLRMKSGGDILLPETDMAAALAQLNQMQISHKLLDRPYARLDMRTSGTLILRPTTEVLSVNASSSAVKSARGV